MTVQRQRPWRSKVLEQAMPKILRGQSLNPAEESAQYWWYYHDMEIPTEEQLATCVTRYSVYNSRWATFLFVSYPNKINYDKMIRFGTNLGRTVAMIRNLMREIKYPLDGKSITLLRLVRDNRLTRRMAQRAKRMLIKGGII